MLKTIQQTVHFDAPPERVYELYANARLHAKVTGAPAKFVAKAGSEFRAHGAYLRGKLLLLEPPRMIVQTWRGSHWKSAEADSVLILRFTRDGKGTSMQMVHANIPAPYAKDLAKGWRSHYWTPWRRYLKSRG